jgi:hypothetical protein
MSVELWIDDGDPWYLSEDIWVVPGSDPNSLPGSPIANTPAYVWTRVRNQGTSPVPDASVRFYWADPSTAITPASAHLIGSSYVSLEPDEEKDVLCITPWTPQFVNEGHECLITEAFAPTDPLPPRSSTDSFSVAEDRHVAQRNISVGVTRSNSARFFYPFLIGNVFRLNQKEADVRVRRVTMKRHARLLARLGFEKPPSEAEGFEDVGLAPFRCGQLPPESGKSAYQRALKPGELESLALVAQLPPRFPQGTGAMFVMEQFAGDKVIGGLAVLIVPESAIEKEGV